MPRTIAKKLGIDPKEFTRINKAIHGSALNQNARLMTGTHLYIPGKNSEIEARLERILNPSRKELERQAEEKAAQKRKINQASRQRLKKKAKDSKTEELEKMVLEMAADRDSDYARNLGGGGGGGGSLTLKMKLPPKPKKKVREGVILTSDGTAKMTPDGEPMAAGFEHHVLTAKAALDFLKCSMTKYYNCIKKCRSIDGWILPPRLDEHGNVIPYVPEVKKHKLKLDERGNPIQKVDKNGMPMFDEEGNPMYLRDRSVKPKLKLDANGLPIPKLDAEGRHMRDEKGTPMYEYIQPASKKKQKVDADGKPIFDAQGQPVYVEPKKKASLKKVIIKLDAVSKSMVEKDKAPRKQKVDKNGELMFDTNGKPIYHRRKSEKKAQAAGGAGDDGSKAVKLVLKTAPKLPRKPKLDKDGQPMLTKDGKPIYERARTPKGDKKKGKAAASGGGGAVAVAAAAAAAAAGATVAVGGGSAEPSAAPIQFVDDGAGGMVPAYLLRAPFRPKAHNLKKKKLTPSPMVLELGLLTRALFFYEDSWPFRAPVDPAEVPDYAVVINAPMDLATMAQQVADRNYPNIEAFAEHLELVVSNCCQYNLDGSDFVEMANGMQARFARLRRVFSPAVLELEVAKMSPETKAMLMASLTTVMQHPDADIFCEPVPVELIPGYAEEIKTPMDLGSVANKLKRGGKSGYSKVRSFLHDVTLVWENCREFNGNGHPLHSLADSLEPVFLLAFEEQFANAMLD